MRLVYATCTVSVFLGRLSSLFFFNAVSFVAETIRNNQTEKTRLTNPLKNYSVEKKEKKLIMMMQPVQPQQIVVGCCGAFPRYGIVPPNNGPPDNHKVSVLWYFGFALLYVVSIITYAISDYYGNILFYPLVFATVFSIYQFGYKRFVKQHRINPQRTRFPDIFRFVWYFVLCVFI